MNLAVVALFSPWIPTAVAWTRSVNKQFWVQPMTPMEITFHIYAGSWAALGLLVALAVVGVARTRRRGRLALLLALATLPVVIPVIISSIGRPTFTNRYGIVAPAALDALAGIGVAATGIQFVQVACVAALCVLAPFARPEHGPKPQWRQAGAYLTTAMRPGDVAVVNRRAATYLYEYYVHRPDMRPRGFDGEAIPLSLPLRPGQHVWLIVHSDLVTPQQILGRAHWRVLSERHFHMIDIYELEEDRPAPSTSP